MVCRGAVSAVPHGRVGRPVQCPGPRFPGSDFSLARPRAWSVRRISFLLAIQWWHPTIVRRRCQVRTTEWAEWIIPGFRVDGARWSCYITPMQNSGKTSARKATPKASEWGSKRRKAEARYLKTTTRRDAIRDARDNG